jgi:hypothetical protein
MHEQNTKPTATRIHNTLLQSADERLFDRPNNPFTMVDDTHKNYERKNDECGLHESRKTHAFAFIGLIVINSQ